MGQKVRPTGFRVGIVEDWRSRWYAPKKEFGRLLVEDQKIRQFVKKRFAFAGISVIEIERTREEVKVILRTARPGLIIGRKGAEVDRLRDEIEELTGRRITINIIEIAKPELSAQLVAEAIAEQLEKRASFRRTIKQKVEQVMQAGAKGVRIMVKGRLGGAEMSRKEDQHQGSIPLQTLDAHIDFGLAEAHCTYGTTGVKVWIHLGAYKTEEEAADGVDAEAG